MEQRWPIYFEFCTAAIVILFHRCPRICNLCSSEGPFECSILQVAITHCPDTGLVFSRVDDCLDSLGDAAVFTTLDCNSGYWQVPFAP